MSNVKHRLLNAFTLAIIYKQRYAKLKKMILLFSGMQMTER
jgi:hypothetical protein